MHEYIKSIITKERDENNILYDKISSIYRIKVFNFSIRDVEEPDLYAAKPIQEWQQSDQGKFIMENSIEIPTWQRVLHHEYYSYEYIIIAYLEEKKLAEFYLRWGPAKK